MNTFIEPVCEVVRFVGDMIATSNCNCDFGFGQVGDDSICDCIKNGTMSDVECVIQDEQGNC